MSAIAPISWVDDRKPNIHLLLTANISIKRNRVLATPINIMPSKIASIQHR